MPTGPGAVLGPNSKTSRSKPAWWATRTATSCTWFEGLPPVARGQAAAGVDPGPGAMVGSGAVTALGRAVTAPVAATVGVAAGGREADGAGVGDGAASCCGVHALTTTIPSAISSAAYITSRPNIRCKPEYTTACCRVR